MTGWTRQGAILVFVVLAAFAAAHIVTGMLSHALLPPLEHAAQTTQTQTAAAPLQDIPQLLRQLEATRLFALPPAGSVPLSTGGGPSAGPGGMVAGRAPLNVASKVRLLGTVAGDAAHSLAILEEIVSKKQGAYRLHDMVPGVGQVHTIDHESIVIGLDGMEEELFLDILQRPVPPPAATMANAAPVAPGTVVTPGGGPIHKSVDRAELDQTLSNIPGLMTQARAMPFMNNGKMEGFRLEFIQKGSFFEKLGLQAGDVLQRINGVELRDPGMALGLFQQLRTERNVAVDVLRNNQRTTLAYDIQG